MSEYTPEQLRSEAEGLDSFSPGISGRWVAPRLIAFAAALERIKVLEGRYEQLAAHAEAMYHADDEEQLAIVCLAYRKWRDGE